MDSDKNFVNLFDDIINEEVIACPSQCTTCIVWIFASWAYEGSQGIKFEYEERL
jgi:hypothetical protein